MRTTVDDVSIHYEIEGDGPAIVLVHGLGMTSDIWRTQQTALSRDYKVLLYDLSGSGRSDRSRRPYSIDSWSDELAGLLDVAGIERATIVGHAMATLIAQRFAARYPRRTKALVLVGPVTELSPALKAAVLKRAERVEGEGMAAVAETIVQRALSAETRRCHPELADWLYQMLLGHDPFVYAGHCRALAAASTKEEQPKINCATLLIAGEDSPVASTSELQAMAEAFPTASLRTIPGAAVMPMLERSEGVNDLLREFLDKQKRNC